MGKTNIQEVGDDFVVVNGARLEIVDSDTLRVSNAHSSFEVPTSALVSAYENHEPGGRTEVSDTVALDKLERTFSATQIVHEDSSSEDRFVALNPTAAEEAFELLGLT